MRRTQPHAYLSADKSTPLSTVGVNVINADDLCWNVWRIRACPFVQQFHFGGNYGKENGKCKACGKLEEHHPRDPKGNEKRRFCYDFMYR